MFVIRDVFLFSKYINAHAQTRDRKKFRYCTMNAQYTHSSFTLLQTTEQIREVVDHVLSQPDTEVCTQLRSDLSSWRDRDKTRCNGTSSSVEDVSGTIPFDLLKRAHKQLAKTPLGTAYFAECMN